MRSQFEAWTQYMRKKPHEGPKLQQRLLEDVVIFENQEAGDRAQSLARSLCEPGRPRQTTSARSAVIIRCRLPRFNSTSSSSVPSVRTAR